jgi:Holliday junction resolvasome RuvABC DNA-binding subunit
LPLPFLSLREGENYSVEHLRRALNIGYKKAKRIFDEMEGRMAKAATGPSTDDDYNGKAAPTPKVGRFCLHPYSHPF